MKKSLYTLNIIFILISCKTSNEVIDTQTTIDNSSLKWQTVNITDQSKPIQRHEAAFVRVGEKFYLLGGRRIQAVSIYNSKTGSWSKGAMPPIEMHHFQPITYQNKIYIIGAMTGKYPAETPTTHVYIYDPKKDEWSKGAEIPENRRRGSTGNVLYNDVIYISCGIKDGHRGDHKNWLDSYNLTSGEWNTLPDAPRARDHFQAVLSNDNIYVLAGRNTKSADNPFKNTIGEVDVYNINSKTWKTLPNNLPTLRAGNMAILFNDEIVVVGGESDTQPNAFDTVEALNPETNEWRKLSSLVRGRHGSGLLEYKNALYIASGCGNAGGSPELFTMEKFDK